VRGTGSRSLDFSSSWENAATRGFITTEQIFVLGAHITTLEEAIQSLVNFFGLDIVERSDRVKSGSRQHTLLLSGVFRGGKEILVRAKLVLTNRVTMQFTVRTQDPRIAELMMSLIG
jgi:coatomer protein complex subunit gamma